ncbi:MAG: glycosyltransferase [Flavobacterium sp.]|nr:MAG: glycosyltransferase [Flavobacterium sp.]
MKISVVIPVKNGAATLDQCLSSIRFQTLSDIEIIVLDSMSNDGSRDIAKKYNAVIADIPLGTFNHGLTRNIGAQKASADLVYFTVQDAWMPDDRMLETMSAHFEDGEVGAVVGHQATPWGHIDKNPVLWFKRYSQPVVGVRHFPNGSFNNLTQREQFEQSGWDDVNAMYRKTTLLAIPFRETNFSEDWLWANDALRNGVKIFYDPSLVVYHYHHMYFAYTFKSKFILNYYFFKFFNQLPSLPMSPLGVSKAIYLLISRREVRISKKFYWILYNTSFSIANFLSVLIFRLAYFLGKKPLLNRAYKMICSEVPQGRLK